MNATLADAGKGNWLADRPRTVADLRAKYRHLVWSNPDAAPDDVYVYAALIGGEFHQILDFACVLGLERLRIAWQALRADEPEEPDLRRAAPHVERILRHIQAGWDRLATPPPSSRHASC